MIHYLALHYWSQLQKNLTTFGGLWPEKHPEVAKNLKFGRHLKTPELHIRHENRKGGRREGILKLLVKVSLKFERSFGDLLYINPQKCDLNGLEAS